MVIIANPIEFRDNIRARFVASVGLNATGAANLEISIFNSAISNATNLQIVKKWENPLFVQIYVNRLHSVFVNIADPVIAEKLRTRNIQPQDFAELSHQEMAPEKWKCVLEKKAKRDASKFENTMHASTDMFKCKKCKSKKCSYYELQTRSADESMTIFIQCLDCGKQWKQ